MGKKVTILFVALTFLFSGIAVAELNEEQLIDLLVTLGDPSPMVAWDAHLSLQRSAPEHLALNQATLEKVLPLLADPARVTNVINLFLRSPESGKQLLLETLQHSNHSLLILDQTVRVLGQIAVHDSQVVTTLVNLVKNEQTPYLLRVTARDVLKKMEVKEEHASLVDHLLESTKSLNEYVYQNQIVFRIDNNLAEPIDNQLVVGLLSIPEMDLTIDNLAVLDQERKPVQSSIKQLSSWSSGSPRIVEITLPVSIEAHGVATYFLSLDQQGNSELNIASDSRVVDHNAISFRFLGEGISGFTDLGFSKNEGWSDLMIVAADGSGQFRTVQAAIDAVPVNNQERVYIYIRDGVYREKIDLPANKPFISLIGESSEGTILTHDDSARTIGPDGTELGTTGSASFFARADDFTAENLTFQNSAGMYAGQAVAIRTYGDRLIFKNVRFLGYQDTLYVTGGRQYFVNCYIRGDVDFIFGDATAVFENCDIVATDKKEGGYLTAASTQETSEFGYVIINSRLTGEGDPNNFYLGRPWRPYGAVAILDSWIGDHIRPVGWHNWNNATNEKTARYVEYNNCGPGADIEQRVPWSRVLTEEEAADYTVENVLKGSDGWNPKVHD